jgi:hypothetical protein
MKSRQKKLIINITILSIILIFLLIFFNILYKDEITINKNYSNLNLNNYNNLMIISHPGDELLWGTSKLLEDNYLVVCITCGSEITKTEEFYESISSTNDQYIILGYEEYSGNERSNWSDITDDLTKDLKEIIELRNWDKIVTHNPNGEYGHAQHKITSNIVTSITTNNLYYFGNYYNKKTIGNHTKHLVPISQNTLNKKQELIGIYNSEQYFQTSFNHMFPYENWISYEEWGE